MYMYVPFASQKNEKMKFQRHMKDNTNLELSSKQKGLKMSLSGKIASISCQIDFNDCNHFSNSLIFRPLYQMVLSFVMRKDSISLILVITRSDVDKCCCHLYSSFYVCYLNTPKRREKASQSLNSV